MFLKYKSALKGVGRKMELFLRLLFPADVEPKLIELELKQREGTSG